MNRVSPRVFAFLFLLFIAGLIGSFIRVSSELLAPSYFLFSLLIVNIAGCVYAGYWTVKKQTSNTLTQEPSIHVIGLAGGMTTFAGFALVVHPLVMQGQFLLAALWLIATLLLSGLAFFVTIRFLQQNSDF